MTPTNHDFFDDLKDWSERKLQLLENYVAAASKIMGIIGQVYYIDGFAGEGIYDDGSKGSPVRIAELAQRYEREAKPYCMRLFAKTDAGLWKFATNQVSYFCVNLHASCFRKMPMSTIFH